jgi:hypothetical protein
MLQTPKTRFYNEVKRKSQGKQDDCRASTSGASRWQHQKAMWGKSCMLLELPFRVPDKVKSAKDRSQYCRLIEEVLELQAVLLARWFY